MAEKNDAGEKSKPKLHPLVAKLLWPLVIIGAAGFAWFGYKEWQRGQTRISTDNAEVKSLVVKIFAPEQGYVTAVQARENDLVSTKDTLVKLEDDFYQWEVERAQANFNLAQTKLGTTNQPGLNAAQLQSAQANLQLITAQLNAAQQKLNESEQQVKELQAQKDKPGFVQSTLTKALSDADTWQASVNTLEKQQLFAQKQIAEEQASQRLGNYNLDQAKAELESARLRLTNTNIRSPINGYVAQQNISPGVLVQPNQYLMAIVSKTNTWITANIKESKIERVKPGDPVIISLDAFPSETFYGELESISPAAGSQFALIPQNNASGNFIKTEALIPVRITILDPDKKTRLLPGMSATVDIMIDPLNENDKQVVAFKKAKAAVEARLKKQQQSEASSKTEAPPAASSATDAKDQTSTNTSATTNSQSPNAKSTNSTPSGTTPSGSTTKPTNDSASPAKTSSASPSATTPADTTSSTPKASSTDTSEAPTPSPSSQSPASGTSEAAVSSPAADNTATDKAASGQSRLKHAEAVAESHGTGPVGTAGE